MFRKFTNSIFPRFTLLLGLSAVAVTLVTHLVLRTYFEHLEKTVPVPLIFHRMADYTAEILGVDPDEDYAAALLEEYGFDLRYEHGDIVWSTASDLPSLAEVEQVWGGSEATWHRRMPLSVVRRGEAIYIFRGSFYFDGIAFPLHLFAIWLVSLTAIFLFVHTVVRRLLSPLRTLQKGVESVGRGDFAITLPKKGTKEFSNLIDSFNNMSAQIQRDIHSRDQLLRDISHELRSPLSRMMVALEFVSELSIRKILKKNILLLERMTSLILEEERLDSPFGKIKRREVDIKDLILDIVETLPDMGVAVKLPPCENITLFADVERLRMALSNIVENALKYSPPDADPVIITWCREGECLTIRVCDSGPGIPREELANIFEPFYRVDKARQSTTGGYGLGMGLAKKIVDAHGGDISVSSSSGGTEVAIKLPFGD